MSEQDALVERVARAIWNATGRLQPWDMSAHLAEKISDGQTAVAVQRVMREARAAIAAVRSWDREHAPATGVGPPIMPDAAVQGAGIEALLEPWEPQVVRLYPTYSGELGARGEIVGWSAEIGHHDGGLPASEGYGPTIADAIRAAVAAAEGSADGDR